MNSPRLVVSHHNWPTFSGGTGGAPSMMAASSAIAALSASAYSTSPGFQGYIGMIGVPRTSGGATLFGVNGGGEPRSVAIPPGFVPSGMFTPTPHLGW